MNLAKTHKDDPHISCCNHIIHHFRFDGESTAGACRPDKPFKEYQIIYDILHMVSLFRFREYEIWPEYLDCWLNVFFWLSYLDLDVNAV